MAINAIMPRYPPSRTQPNHTCSNPCSILIAKPDCKTGLQTLAGPVVGNQAVDHVLVNLDLALLDQKVLHTAFKQGIAVARALRLDLIANRGALRLKLREIRA